MAARSWAGMAAVTEKARLAAAMAASTSSGVAIGTAPITVSS